MPEPTHPSADLGEDKDGRSVRRDRNVQLAVNAARELFEETRNLPTIEDVAARSGLSIRSMYRYFKDIGEVTESVVELVSSEARAASQLPDPAGVSTADRIDAFARARVTIYELVRGTFLANIARMIHSPEIAQSGAAIRAAMRSSRTSLNRNYSFSTNPTEVTPSTVATLSPRWSSSTSSCAGAR